MTDDKHQNQVDELIKHDRRITQKQIAVRLGMSKESGLYHRFTWLHKSLFSMGSTHGDAGKKQIRVEICEELLKRYREAVDQFLLNIVTGDESWNHHFDPEEKRTIMEYRHTSSPRPKKFKTMPSAGKILLTIFLALTQS